MYRHPGGKRHTDFLFSAAALSPCRILDMGAGDGDTVSYLRILGYDALGVDLNPSADRSDTDAEIIEADFLACPFPDGSFDALISECAFFVSGDYPAALREARRLLKPGGKLLLADVCFLGKEELLALLYKEGFLVTAIKDASSDWKEYYLRSIWQGEDLQTSCNLPEGKCEYFLTVSERMLQDGFAG